jgi:methionyl aminopeptidase
MAIILKSAAGIQGMKDAARINDEALICVRDAIRPGVRTRDLNEIAHNILLKYGATPAFLGYTPNPRQYPPFPATITVAVNEELVHGIPGDRVLQEGDIITIDCGSIYGGWVADAAYTAPVGKISAEAQRLLDVTEQALYKGIEASVPDNHLGDVSFAIQSYVEGQGMNVVREYGGHGVGRSMHEDPHVPNHGQPGRGIRLKSGMTYALEPMVMLGGHKVRVLPDRWTVVTADGRWCAHFEHSIHITENGPEILTKW